MICDPVLLSCTTSWAWMEVLFTCIAQGFIPYWPWMFILLFLITARGRHESRIYPLYFVL